MKKIQKVKSRNVSRFGERGTGKPLTIGLLSAKMTKVSKPAARDRAKYSVSQGQYGILSYKKGRIIMLYEGCHVIRFPFWRERGTASLLRVVESRAPLLLF